jgi:tRNA pseudouridine32 synthase/23S rRNA pseudouridine746 synthase
MRALRVLHRDDALVVVDKPAGLLAVPGRGADKQDCAWHRVLEACPDAHVVHRLDMATSGLLLFARGSAIQRALSSAFAKRQVVKSYVAVVAGLVAVDRGAIDLPLAADWPNRPRHQVDPVRGKAALTRFQVLSRDPATATSRLTLTPVTGRTHQLRVHLSAIGHPIIGDALYAADAPASRLMLHAAELALAHPVTGTATAWRSEPPF